MADDRTQTFTFVSGRGIRKRNENSDDDYDVLFIQGLELLPIPTLLEVFSKIEAKKVLVWRVGNLPTYKGLYKLNFDEIVCFDFRFKSMLKGKYPEEIISIIPFPCRPVAKVKGDSDKKESKE